ncbi:acetate--CoA ligase [Metallosphaera tengchongensis]|uniref:Acetate--CoA ligase n=1 Tax=Metallosphaera tengchongensis TaxID=1532350 RepID=A0A6N0NWQ4_9CREN|nr:AMP-binding protein [Metallosphaera tengchongensis]QKR00657.1 acetate--CoA ligase [Metallosphaera tengchongensis]
MNVEIFSLDKIRRLAEEAKIEPERFWAHRAWYLEWFRKPKVILEGRPPNDSWFVGGLLNIAYNAVDRHYRVNPDGVAFYWMSERGDTRTVSYRDLYCEVNRASHVLKELGVKRGDSVSLIMPSIPEAVYFSLAVHRLGGVLVIHYLGLSEDTLAYRLNDCRSRVMVIASSTTRNGKEIEVKRVVDSLLEKFKTPVEKVLVVKRGEVDTTERDVIYDDVKPRGRVFVDPEAMESNEPATVYYTSGTTGRPKGLYHTNGGYLVALNWSFDALLKPRKGDVWWTISELGWPVWPMANLYTIPVMGLTGVLFEGYVGHKADLFSRVVERFGVNLVWSSTTTLYTLKSLGEESINSGDVSSLRAVLNTGEPLNTGARKWLRDRLRDVYIADAYWMTEHLLPIAATPMGLGEVPYKPGSAGITFPGSSFAVVDDDGNPLPPMRKGYIVLNSVNPAMAKMYNDPNHERMVKTYWSRFPGYFYTGDYGYVDEEGYLYVIGRADDVITKEGERIGTMEVESIAANHPSVAEATAVGYERDGSMRIVVLVVPRAGLERSERLEQDVKAFLRNAGVIVDRVVLVSKLPKTKSGKIMRRLVRAILQNDELGDTSTLDSPDVLNELRDVLSK